MNNNYDSITITPRGNLRRDEDEGWDLTGEAVWMQRLRPEEDISVTTVL